MFITTTPALCKRSITSCGGTPTALTNSVGFSSMGGYQWGWEEEGESAYSHSCQEDQVGDVKEGG